MRYDEGICRKSHAAVGENDENDEKGESDASDARHESDVSDASDLTNGIFDVHREFGDSCYLSGNH
jgi:hypothetical protein